MSNRETRNAANRTHEELRKIIGSFSHPDALTGCFHDQARLSVAKYHQMKAEKHLAYIMDLLNLEAGEPDGVKATASAATAALKRDSDRYMSDLLNKGFDSQ